MTDETPAVALDAKVPKPIRESPYPLRARILRVRASQNQKIVDVEWSYIDDLGVAQVVLADGVTVPAMADDAEIVDRVNARRAWVRAEVGDQIPNVGMNDALVGKVLE